MKQILIALVSALILVGCNKNAPIQPENYKTSSPENMKEVCDFIKACPCYYIATVEGDQPRVRPFGTVNIFEDKLYIQTGHKKNVAQQIATNPKVEICAYNGQEWLRVSATLVDDPRIEAKRAMLEAYPELQSMYSAEDDNTAVFYLTNAIARFCSFTSPEKVVEF